MYLLPERLRAAAGLHRYEISNYAREGRECRHNKVYWHRGDYVGFGLGASSMVADIRWKNPEDREAYTECVECMSGRTEFPKGLFFAEMLRETGRLEVQELTETARMEELMVLGLRLTAGIDPADFQRMFGTPVEAVYGETIARLTAQGLLELSGKWLRLTPRGIDVSNRVFAEFLF